MEKTGTVFAVSAAFLSLLLVLQQTPTVTAQCSPPASKEFPENNVVGAVVVTIPVDVGVDLSFTNNPDDTFRLDGNNLIAQRVLDHEKSQSFSVGIVCESKDLGKTSHTIIVVVKNRNDNPPVFEFSSYNINVSELAAVNSSVRTYPATDLDNQQLTYTLTPTSGDFRLLSPSTPTILVNARLNYDTVKNVQLVLIAQDSPLESGDGSSTASTTININILDGDDRPPWFQPCRMHELGPERVCVSDGYTGLAVLNEQQTEPLALKPGPLFAIDGDSGINDAIRYSFLSGNEDGLFEINPTTGNITMLKPVNVVDPISLSVLAVQETNSRQFATTTVTIGIHAKSLHRPEFERALYEGIVTSAGGMALNAADTNNPLRIVATDDDYLAAGGINPNIIYSIIGSDDFTITNSFLFMTRNIPDTTLTLQVTATDTTNDESATTNLRVEVKAGVTSTTRPPTTAASTSGVTATKITPNTVTGGGEGTPSTGGSGQTGSGGYGVSDMAALGGTLGILLLLSLVVIGLLVYRMRKGKTNSKKIYEASMFISSLRQDGLKEGIQYTNDAFQHDDDKSDSGSRFPSKAINFPPPEPVRPLWSSPSEEAVLRTSAPLHDLLPDNASDTGSDKLDGEKEVKPILTKERRVEEGYKSVWFKEDIDPNAKEEVVIIPDSREHDSDDEDNEDHEDNEDNEDDEDNEGDDKKKASKVMFADSDMDSGLGVKIEDPAEDSDNDSEQNIYL